MRHEKIIFVGLARDAGNYLPQVLSNIERISSLVSESYYLFIENDSMDETKGLLNDWGAHRKNFSLLCMDGVGKIPIRTLRLEYLRNLCVEYIKKNEQLRSYTHIMVLDMDDSNALTINLDGIIKSLDFLSQADSRAAVFANQIGHYYDLWALRHDQLCPNDAWEEVLDYALSNGVSDHEAFEKTFKARIFCLGQEVPPFEVSSAFGGLGIYKLSYVLDNPNPYLGSKLKLINAGSGIEVVRWQVCEHVHFNLGIKAIGGELFINPSMINGVYSSPIYPPSAYKTLLFN